MKILFYRYGSICEPDLLDSFEELGHTVTQITDEIYNKDLVFGDCIRIVSESLMAHPQDAVFTINFFPMVSDVCEIFHIPYISWTVDSPVMELFAHSIRNSCNRVFLFDRIQFEEISPFNPERVFHFPLGGAYRTKQDVIRNASPTQSAAFASEVSFVGSLYTEKSPFDKLLDPSLYLQGFLNGLMSAQKKVYGYYFADQILTEEMIQDFKSRMPGYYEYPLPNFLTDRIIVSQLYLGNKITALERIDTVSRLSRCSQFDLYTGSDTSFDPKIHNLGLAKTLTEMPLIFHNSLINLNTTSKIIRSGIPQRIFDILSCEGFVLTNYQPELPELFQIGEELDVYFSLDEMEEKVRYYLEHPARCREIAHQGFLRLRESYSLTSRLEQLLLLAFSH